MALVEFLGQSGGGNVPAKQPPVTLECAWDSLPGDRFEAIAELIGQARFAAGVVNSKKAYVVITGVLDDRTAYGFLSCVLNAYDARQLNKTVQIPNENG